MMRTLLFYMGCMIAFQVAHAQYEFKDIKRHDCTSVKSQDRTGTCWSFATSSFIESELMRQGKSEIDLSEMYVVRNIYKEKAFNYVYRQGKANFSQGSLAHDMIAAYRKYGAVPESVYSGKDNEEIHNHSELANALEGLLSGVIKSKTLSDDWMEAVDGVLDAYLGEAPSSFTYAGKTYSPQSFKSTLGIEGNEFINLTSFTHHPFYAPFILEIPDNFSNGSFYNLPLIELLQVLDHAIANGFTVAWDGDVSEKSFSGRKGLAVLPKELDEEKVFDNPGEEIKVTQENRQENFESYSTTDDHLMHIVGSAIDQNDTPYYIVKNSWGEISEYKGFLYMSRPYAAMKTISITVHKDALPKAILKKLNL